MLMSYILEAFVVSKNNKNNTQHTTSLLPLLISGKRKYIIYLLVCSQH